MKATISSGWLAWAVILSLLSRTIVAPAADKPDTGNRPDDFYRFVDGYPAAFNQLKQQLISLMREKPLVIVWLIDESDSLSADRKILRDLIPKFHEDLAAQKENKQNPTDNTLINSIMSFGAVVTERTDGSTTQVVEIRDAIDQIQIDPSGKERTCKALSTALAKYGPLSEKLQRRLVVLIVSDESGDDGEAIEDCIEQAKKFQSRVYLLGREASFGYPYAKLAWTDPKFKLRFWLTVDRGPETAYPELLQSDGLHEHSESIPSGFGPFELMRLTRETRGLYFILPDAKEAAANPRSLKDLPAELAAMKKYLPDLTSRIEYAKERDSNKFRAAQWQVINVLNPYKDRELSIQEIHYSTDPEDFSQQGARAFQQAIRSLKLFNEGLKLLETVQPLRADEPSLRWRANYDLLHAQCQAYRVRLFQLLLALDQHKKLEPAPRRANGVENNVWNVVRQKAMLEPDPMQIKLTKIDFEELTAQKESAMKEFQAVIDEHPHTPWARRAKDELDMGFGIRFVDGYYDFNAFAAARNIKLPTP